MVTLFLLILNFKVFDRSTLYLIKYKTHTFYRETKVNYIIHPKKVHFPLYQLLGYSQIRAVAAQVAILYQFSI